ncbi:MAG TPA: formyltetrahydrofolate deformylase [Bacteroidota bacterium]|nr:formyltetrahydrofolate deformylase [Bacteroidota bacterium]
MAEQPSIAILLWSCPDQKGLVARITHFIFERGGNIIDLDEHVDAQEQRFFLRIAWAISNNNFGKEDLLKQFAPLAQEFQATYNIRLVKHKRNLALLVSKYDHCLQEILWRYEIGEFNTNIALIISNHPDLEPLAQRYHIPYYLFPITKENKQDVEAKELQLLKQQNVDSIVLARYMQVLSSDFIKQYPQRIINIHHSFLPAFAGGNPYRQAFDRGVKIVGATSHYVTEVLDEGPIIEQDIIRISHKDSLEDLIRKGRDLERLVLARALRLHLQDRVLVHGNKTVVFD